MKMFLTIKLCTYANLNFLKIEQIIYIKMDLALNNLQKLICHKTQQTKPNHIQAGVHFLVVIKYFDCLPSGFLQLFVILF